MGTYPQEVRTAYTTAQGLPDNDVRAVAVAGGQVYAGTRAGLATLTAGRWEPVKAVSGAPVEALAPRGNGLLVVFRGALQQWENGRLTQLATLPQAANGNVRGLAAAGQVWVATSTGLLALESNQLVPVAALNTLLGEQKDVRQVAARSDGSVAVAADAGLFWRDSGSNWRAVYPHQAGRSWAPRDVRGVAYDAQGRLWFASPQGVGRLDGQWTLYTEQEGLPYDDFTTLAAGEQGVVWMGTRRGAIRFDGRTWEYRQGLRWLPDDDVRGIAVTKEGHTWFATSAGASVIERRPMTLAQKARFFEDEIDKRHRRTPYGYVLSVSLPQPGDTSTWRQHDSDNDGLWTSMYGAGVCYAYAATRDPLAKKRARAAFEALRFLSTVTQGGTPPAPPGFVARTILPTSGPDPNATHYTRARDENTRATRDRLWKVLVPRWPKSADGQWYWKADTSSDELDGHYFFYAQYYDLVAETEAEKEDVRKLVAGITDHLLANHYALIDWDGTPTRWAVFGPQELNFNPDWWVERGLNSLSLLSYLRTTEHITGNPKYGQAAERLVRENSYAINTLVPKIAYLQGSGNHSDDEMAFMGYYNLLQYEKDPALRNLYAFSYFRYWQMEKPELNPLFNFMYAGRVRNETYRTPHREVNLAPYGNWLEESVDTLRRFPLDRINWRLTNSHRKDIVRLMAEAQDQGDVDSMGYRRNGTVLPIDERFVEHWNQNPYRLDQGGQGNMLADGASFLLPYYMGLYHRFILE